MSAGKSTRKSTRSAAKNYLSTLFDNDTATASTPAPAAAAAATAPSSSDASQPAAKKKKTVAASKAQQANEAAAPAAAAAAAAAAKGKAKAKPSASSSSSSSSAAASSSSSSSTPASSSSSSFPVYPAAPSSTSFVFDASLPLSKGCVELLREILGAEQARVDATYGSGKAAGKFQYIAEATRDVGQSFMKQLESTVADALQAESNGTAGAGAAAASAAPVLEHAGNTAARESLAKWAAFSTQTRSELEAWRAIVAELEDQSAAATTAAAAAAAAASKASSSSSSSSSSAAAAAAAAAGSNNGGGGVKLDESDEAFLAAHRGAGGRLTAMVGRALASSRVKGDASAHALERLQGLLQGVQADQQAMSARLNAQEKKVYGAAIDDPRDLIAMVTGAAGAE